MVGMNLEGIDTRIACSRVRMANWRLLVTNGIKQWRDGRDVHKDTLRRACDLEYELFGDCEATSEVIEAHGIEGIR